MESNITKNESYKIIEYNKFEKMDLNDNLLKGIYSYGFETPSKIQAQAIVPIILKYDVIVQSQSGTGKTGTFVISTLETINLSIKECQVLVIAHTKELATQIYEVYSKIGKYTKITPVLCIGGTNINDAKQKLINNISVVIGTPGRIYDMLEKTYLKSNNINMLVLDEADELLSFAFINQVKNIFSKIKPTAQICIFSATLPIFVLDLTNDFMNNPLSIRVLHEELTLSGISQYYIKLNEENDKFETLCDLYEAISIGQSIIYVNTKRKVDFLKKQLEERQFTISVIHSDLTSVNRIQIMADYRAGKSRILISTDLLSRGIDIQQVSVVINYDLPTNKECYLHRIGRSGRYGKKGTAINFVTTADFWIIKELNSFYNTSIIEMTKDTIDNL